MKISLYNMWLDYTLYLYLLTFIISFIVFLYAIKKIISFNKEEEIKEEEMTSILINDNDINMEEKEKPISNLPLFEKDKKEEIKKEPNIENQNINLSPAEEFIKNISETLLSIDERLKTLEEKVNISKKPQNTNIFVLKFLEDILSDYDSLDKEKIKARINFIVSDIKK